MAGQVSETRSAPRWAPGHRARRQPKMPSRARALTVGEGLSTLILRRVCSYPRPCQDKTASAQVIRYKRDFADPLGMRTECPA